VKVIGVVKVATTITFHSELNANAVEASEVGVVLRQLVLELVEIKMAMATTRLTMVMRILPVTNKKSCGTEEIILEKAEILNPILPLSYLATGCVLFVIYGHSFPFSCLLIDNVIDLCFIFISISLVYEFFKFKKIQIRTLNQEIGYALVVETTTLLVDLIATDVAQARNKGVQ
jgi:hypothetical protein